MFLANLYHNSRTPVMKTDHWIHHAHLGLNGLYIISAVVGYMLNRDKNQILDRVLSNMAYFIDLLPGMEPSRLATRTKLMFS